MLMRVPWGVGLDAWVEGHSGRSMDNVVLARVHSALPEDG